MLREDAFDLRKYYSDSECSIPEKLLLALDLSDEQIFDEQFDQDQQISEPEEGAKSDADKQDGTEVESRPPTPEEIEAMLERVCARRRW